MWNRFSIKVQLLIFLTALISVVEIGTLFAIIKIQESSNKTNATLDVETISKSLNNDLLKTLLNPTADILSDINFRLAAFSKINGVVLYSNKNKTVFEYGKTKQILEKEKEIESKESIFNEDNLFVKKDISADGYSFGYILIDIDLSPYKLQDKKITSTIFMIFPFALLLGFLLSLLISKSYTKPFSKLLNAMKKSKPTQNEIIVVETSAQNEIKELFDEFNKQMNLINVSSQEISSLSKEIEDTQKEVVFTMGAIGESRSKETGNHVKRVAEYSKVLALHYGLKECDAEMLKQASPMHDIGKVAIPDAVLNKPGRFNEEERKIMDTHAVLGYEMLNVSNKALLKMAAVVAHEHHEKWDGSGYPRGLAGEDINIYGRITALADVFDALGSDRVYKKAWDDERIFNLFKEERGKHFDPKLVDIFFENLDSFLKIRDKFKDL